MRYLRTCMIGIGSGAIAGIVWALGARVAMRLVALQLEQPVSFSVAGTLLIVLFGLFFGIPLGLLLTASGRYLPRRTMWRGLVNGLLVLVALGYPFYLGPIRDEGSSTPLLLSIVLFGGLLVLFGVVVSLANAGLERRLPLLGPGRARKLSLVALALVSSFELFIFGLMLVAELQ